MSGNFDLRKWKLPSFCSYEIIIGGFSGNFFYMPFIAFHQLLNLMGQCGKPMERLIGNVKKIIVIWNKRSKYNERRIYFKNWHPKKLYKKKIYISSI